MPFKDVDNARRLTKFSSVPGEVPAPGSLRAGELALNISDGKVFIGGGPQAAPIPLVAGGADGSIEAVINDPTVVLSRGNLTSYPAV